MNMMYKSPELKFGSLAEEAYSSAKKDNIPFCDTIASVVSEQIKAGEPVSSKYIDRIVERVNRLEYASIYKDVGDRQVAGLDGSTYPSFKIARTSDVMNKLKESGLPVTESAVATPVGITGGEGQISKAASEEIVYELDESSKLSCGSLGLKNALAKTASDNYDATVKFNRAWALSKTASDENEMLSESDVIALAKKINYKLATVSSVIKTASVDAESKYQVVHDMLATGGSSDFADAKNYLVKSMNITPDEASALITLYYERLVADNILAPDRIGRDMDIAKRNLEYTILTKVSGEQYDAATNAVDGLVSVVVGFQKLARDSGYSSNVHNEITKVVKTASVILDRLENEFPYNHKLIPSRIVTNIDGVTKEATALINAGINFAKKVAPNFVSSVAKKMPKMAPKIKSFSANPLLGKGAGTVRGQQFTKTTVGLTGAGSLLTGSMSAKGVGSEFAGAPKSIS